MPFAQGSFWSLLDDEDRAALRAVGTVRGYPDDAVLLREGEPAAAVVVLLSGHVKATAVAAATGHEAVFAVLGPGDILGELSSMDGEPCTATVRVIDGATGISVAPGRFHALLDRRPHIARAVLHVVTSRLRRSNRRQVEYG